MRRLLLLLLTPFTFLASLRPRAWRSAGRARGWLHFGVALDVRFVDATHRDAAGAVNDGAFRAAHIEIATGKRTLHLGVRAPDRPSRCKRCQTMGGGACERWCAREPFEDWMLNLGDREPVSELGPGRLAWKRLNIVPPGKPWAKHPAPGDDGEGNR